MLICPVRGCQLPLERWPRKIVCMAGHSFDMARSGYINLLQPQDRKSKQPGDTVEAVASRRRLHDLGITRPLFDGVAAMLAATDGDVILDAGCGDGFYSGSLAEQTGCAAHGVDISVPAVDAAAKRYPKCEWVVANADRAIPYADAVFNAVMSITARMNPSEFRRVLKGDGRLLVAVASPEDLVELRGKGRDRVPRTVEDFSENFSLEGTARVTTHADLDAEAVNQVLHSIYRPMREDPVEGQRLTFSLDLLSFRPKPSG